MRQRYVPSAKTWPRDKMIAQWERVANDPHNSRYPEVMRIAKEALDNLRADPAREPGED